MRMRTMRSLRTVSYFCSRRLFSQEIKQRSKTALYDANFETSSLKPDEHRLVPKPSFPKFGDVTLKKKPTASRISHLADQSQTLQKLIDLGVEIHVFDRDLSLCKFIMQLDYEKNIEPYLSFLRTHGVQYENLGQFLTENPYVLRCDLDDLQVRINYLESKNFTKNMIGQIITGNPRWLLYEVKTVDSRLGYLQKTLRLRGNDVRALVLKSPKIIGIERGKMELGMVMLMDQLQFTTKDVKGMILKEPALFFRNPNGLMNTFYYLQDHMAVPVHLIIEQPEILLCRKNKLSVRHKFLQKLGRAQYDPKQAGYVPLSDLDTMDDETFANVHGKTKLEVYENFQKTL